jgi:hypothetical protein
MTDGTRKVLKNEWCTPRCCPVHHCLSGVPGNTSKPRQVKGAVVTVSGKHRDRRQDSMAMELISRCTYGAHTSKKA